MEFLGLAVSRSPHQPADPDPGASGQLRATRGSPARDPELPTRRDEETSITIYLLIIMLISI